MKLLKTQFNQKNILGLLNPEEYICQLSEYLEGHSVLIIKVTDRRNNKKMQVIFESVKYFEGPTVWEGANFCTSDYNDLGEIMYKINDKLIENFPSSDVNIFLEQNYRLVYIQLLNVQVRILSASISVE